MATRQLRRASFGAALAVCLGAAVASAHAHTHARPAEPPPAPAVPLAGGLVPASHGPPACVAGAGPATAAVTPDSPIARENARPGSPSWCIDPGATHDIEGFASRTSVQPGETVTMYVASLADRVSATVFRLGYYRGAGAREVAMLPAVAGDPQSACPVDPVTHLVQCAWRPSFSVAVGADWTTGVYLVKLTGSDGAESFVPFVVREAVARAPILVQTSETTWQAYNTWGGWSLYRGTRAGRLVGSVRGYAVSYDRPYLWPGTGELLLAQYPLIYWLESRGYDVAYASDADLHEGRDDLAARRVFVSAGHDEYYSGPMRDALEQALAHGTSLAFLGANDAYRHARFAPSPLGPDRIQICYKDARLDPITRRDPLDATGQWRDLPTARPEQDLIGAQYGAAARTSWVVTGRPAWLFRRTGFRAGDSVPRMVGREYDRVFPGLQKHPGLIVAASSPVPNGERAATTFYVAPSRAGVFDAGTIDFACALGPSPGGCGGVVPDQRVQILTENLLEGLTTHRFV